MLKARRLPEQIAAPFAIDLRTLALFRVSLAAVILVDLVIRACNIEAHYTDDGVWPRDVAAQALSRFGFSLQLISGSYWFQVLILGVTAFVALVFLVGYRTRIANILLWVLIVSINHRNYLVLQTSDTLLLTLLFWSAFLPLGAKFSVDAALSKSDIKGQSIANFASAALILQVLYVYFFGALLKTGKAWVDSGDAVYFALHFSAYASPLGVWFGQVTPPEILRVLTWFVFYIELFGPILVLLPFVFVPMRYIFVPLLMLMHVGFAVFLMVGIYPYLSITSLMVLIPTRFWTRLDKDKSNRKTPTVTIYYDDDCGFCRKISLILRTFLLSDSSKVIAASNDSVAQKILIEQYTWVVKDSDEQYHTHWHAMTTVFDHCWFLRPFRSLYRNALVMRLGETIYALVAKNRGVFGWLSGTFLPYRKINLQLPGIINLIVGFMMVSVLYANICKLPQTGWHLPWKLEQIHRALMLNQYWTMFAPEPGRISLWLFVEGELSDGTKVDVVRAREGAPVLEKPENPAAYYGNYRWRKYFNAANPVKEWPRLGEFYCRSGNVKKWNHSLRRVTGYLLVETTRPEVVSPSSQYDRELQILGRHSCN